jgi:hypothetical protein
MRILEQGASNLQGGGEGSSEAVSTLMLVMSTALPEAAHTRCSTKCSHMHICCIIFLLLGSVSFYINEMIYSANALLMPRDRCTLQDRLNRLDLAPGGHLGLSVIWMDCVFRKLDEVYRTFDSSR